MLKSLSVTLTYLFFATPLLAESLPSGQFQVVNTAGFVQQGDLRTPLSTDGKAGTADIGLEADDSLLVQINESELRLFPLQRGLAALEWDARETALLHDIDIQALFGKKSMEDVPAWGAELIWPGSGTVQMVLLPLRQNAYTGFLISHPENTTVVRQMEFRKISGPANRPLSPGAESRPEPG